MRYFVIVTLLTAIAVVACGGGGSEEKPSTTYILTCKGPTSEVLPGTNGDVKATLTDSKGKPVAGKAVRWSVASAPGPGGLRRDADKAVTDASGQAGTTYLVAFDAGWRGEVTIKAETTDLQPPATCEARFTAISPGLPPPPPRTPAP